jgi:hypothetical protein
MDLAFEVELKPDTIAETRLWQAVILSAVEDWVFGGLRTQQEAERYLFDDQLDFPRVCESAGMDVDRLRSKLKKLREQQSRN